MERVGLARRVVVGPGELGVTNPTRLDLYVQMAVVLCALHGFGRITTRTQIRRAVGIALKHATQLGRLPMPVRGGSAPSVPGGRAVLLRASRGCGSGAAKGRRRSPRGVLSEPWMATDMRPRARKGSTDEGVHNQYMRTATIAAPPL